MTVAIRIEPASWPLHREVLRRLREQVFIDEQNVPRDLEWDGRDDTATHFLASAGEQPIGCARLLPDGQIGRMAVLKEHRGSGIGRLLLDAAIAAARDAGMPRVFLHAQTHAAGFYQRAGFEPVGAGFREAGIPHQAMEMTLGGSAGRFAGEAACADALLQSLAAPRRSLLIYSQLLDPALFDRPAFAEALSAFARSTTQARVRILVNDTALMVSRSHRVLELARRLDSRIAIRRVPPGIALADPTFLCWDDEGYLLLPDHREYLALRDYRDPVRARRFADQFAQLWDRSASDPALRLLNL